MLPRLPDLLAASVTSPPGSPMAKLIGAAQVSGILRFKARRCPNSMRRFVHYRWGLSRADYSQYSHPPRSGVARVCLRNDRVLERRRLSSSVERQQGCFARRIDSPNGAPSGL